MTMNVETRSKLRDIIGNLFTNRSRLGEFDWAILVPDVKSGIRLAMGDDAILEDELLDEIARRLTFEFVQRSKPPVPSDTSQLSLFYDPDALMPLGEREVIRMADARAAHVERWRTVLTANFQAQSNAYFGRVAYIDDRLVSLREAGCTLAEVEAHEIEAAA